MAGPSPAGKSPGVLRLSSPVGWRCSRRGEEVRVSTPVSRAPAMA